MQDPTYVSWHYSIRSSDGKVAQHVATKNVAWHAGNWYVNMHSIGIEHEGFAAQGATWYSESLYRSSARLVRYLAQRYDIPLDRAHVIGHDQVPGTVPASVAGMHWDPGPYWDWEHYFDLLGAPLQADARGGAARVGEVVRIVPGFRRNTQVVTGCDGTAGSPCSPQGTNFVPCSPPRTAVRRWSATSGCTRTAVRARPALPTSARGRRPGRSTSSPSAAATGRRSGTSGRRPGS